jgi:hypothetical protein
MATDGHPCRGFQNEKELQLADLETEALTAKGGDGGN